MGQEEEAKDKNIGCWSYIEIGIEGVVYEY